MTAAAPSGVVTFLFTDIEGSTRRWETDADAMRAALAAHDTVLSEAIGAHGGFMFKHTGDGVCAAFASPKSAVDAAVAAQRALELPVRMGLATGEAELREGDYFGAVLNRAARVMASGHGGQVLLDGTTAGLCSSIDLMALGPRRLRDIAKPVEMFQVLAVGLDSEFPPLTTLDPTPGNLRPQATSFIGREKELAEVEEALSAHRLVTLTGVGGVGKTRLATEVAARLADEFADGVWFFELAAVADPTSVPDAVAAVLGITQQPGKSVSEQRPGLAALLDYAREGDAIVVVGIDRLGRNAAEVMTTIRELGERGIVLRSLREGIDTSNATGRMIAGVLASLAELELGLGRERRAAAREARRARGQHIGRPKVLDKSKVGLAQRMHGSGESASTIASMLGVSRATVYRVLAEQTDKN